MSGRAVTPFDLAAQRAGQREIPRFRPILAQLELLERKYPLNRKGAAVLDSPKVAASSSALNLHPVIFYQLRALLPTPKPGFDYRPDTLLARDLAMGPAERTRLAGAVAEAWNVEISAAAAAEWRTLNDVADTIAGQLEYAAA